MLGLAGGGSCKKSVFSERFLPVFLFFDIIPLEGCFHFFLRKGVIVVTSCVRFSAVLLFVFAIAFFVTACGGGGNDATYASYFVPPAPSPTEPVPDPTADPAVDPTPDPTADPAVDPTPDPAVDPAVDPTPDPAPPDPEPAYENPFKGANVGDMVKFGRYPQTATGDVQDIEWRVLAVDGDKVLAISRYGLDAKRFDDNSNEWEDSEIRGWLNGEFYNSSFNDDEKGIIASSDPGKVFLLSEDEAEGYFSSDEDRKCAPTEYAEANEVWMSDGCCYWWLRSHELASSYSVSAVDCGGVIGYYYGFDYDYGSVRPALWINIPYENPFKGANVGDMVNFGRYPQTATGDVQDIEWRVLAVDGDKVLAISRYGLDAKRFDDNSSEWDDSEIRGWLNGEFYNSSFNDDEKGIITSSNPSKVLLLDKKEAEEYFDSNEDRKCAPTGYAEANNASVSDGCCWWWLLSPYYDHRVYYVSIDGGVIVSDGVFDNNGSVRPALWINLESE